ncbi:hypothetical protein M409DRAFT_24033 [Zasmidium cellare ATCC 36951]|uniref:Translation machinery associated TMA7 n=1 Tax=Zasmidium cellare ATCC 36951 TaxID=1080233 RepID=A0A6A6CF41_ZASCE|nr:uncharacterized protein M409DRAFT_24033 [Zasmidium cellare ATCC 36951]KAF2165745.1 hypothetical protein M409DRAFT_24033 [Zasmidium cellare ATCC 36951]
MPSGQGAGTNPIHNKKPKKKQQEDLDPSEIEHQEKLRADEKKRKELAAKIGGKGGPLNTGGQGIKKSGKK